MLIKKRQLTGLFPLLVCFILAVSPQWSFAAESVVDYIPDPTGHSGVIVDARDAARCETASLSGARCLPVHDMLGPHKRLANFSGLLWLLGTAGLTGDENVLVIGDQGRDKEFLAGVLYLTGQRKISVLTPPLTSLPDAKLSPGISRSKTRENVYRAAMRDSHIVLRSELAGMMKSANAPVILDGRRESEYWGQEIRGKRGGHLPGARHLPLISLKPGRDGAPPIQLDEGEYAIAYGHDSYESIVLLARLIAMGVRTKVLNEGWAGWASDGSLPVDSVTYADLKASGQPVIITPKPSSKIGLPFIVLVILAALALIAAGFFAGRKFSS